MTILNCPRSHIVAGNEIKPIMKTRASISRPSRYQLARNPEIYLTSRYLTARILTFHLFWVDFRQF